MSDLTVIFLTENRLPTKFMRYQRKVLLKAVGDNELITISRRPLKLGKGINLIQKEPRSLVNIWRQLLKGAKKAKTEYIAVAEDDTLYCHDHFNSPWLRAKDGFCYNQCNWKLFNWGMPTYHWMPGNLNYAMIGPRKLTIEALEERFNAGWKEGDPAGELGRRKIEYKLGVTLRPTARVWSKLAIININHDIGFDKRAQKHRKTMGVMKAYDIPYWGRAENIIKKWE